MVVQTDARELDVADAGVDKELLQQPHVPAGCQVHPSALPNPQQIIRQLRHHYGLGSQHCLCPVL